MLKKTYQFWARPFGSELLTPVVIEATSPEQAREQYLNDNPGAMVGHEIGLPPREDTSN